MRFWTALATGGLAFGRTLVAQEVPEPRFGTTVYASLGFQGQIYEIPPGTQSLPDFKKLKPLGTLYTTTLEVPPQSFDKGFPGVTDRFEWFAIDYKGRFWIDKPARYTFGLFSDDGSRLYIDGKEVVDNDGTHPPMGKSAYKKLKQVVHDIRVTYFQGPRYDLALVLLVAAPGEKLHVFKAEDFRPPPDWDGGKSPRHSGKK